MARNRPIAGQRARANLAGAQAGRVGATGPGAGSDGEAGLGAGSAGSTDTESAALTGTRVLEPPVTAASLPDEDTSAQRSGTRLLAGLLALTLSALAAFGLVAYRVRSDQQVETARDQAVAAARDNAEVILSYDYRHLSKDFAAARATLTGGFANDYKVTTAKLVRPGAEQYHVVVKAEVASQSVVSASAHQVVVLLFVNQTTTSTRLDGPRVDLNRVRLTLVKVDGRWLVNKVVAL
jgi:Mce-associated membrane protein